MKARMGGIKRAKIAEKLIATSATGSGLDDKTKDRVTKWCTLFRRNWDIFAEFYLQIPLKPYQRAALHEIGVSDTFFWRAGRGGAKSFVTAIAAICKLLLYPNCWVVVTASTADQANAIVEDKIQRELINKISPILLYYYERNWIDIKKPGDGYIITNNLNNSVLKVLAPVESSRRSRSNFTIYDEVAVMKKSAIDQIFEGMSYPRQPVFLSSPKYKNNPRWIEESKSIYLTSSKYKFQWWYKTWKDCVTGYYVDKRSKFNVFATDFFDNIDNGLKTWGDYRRYKRTMNEFDFRMEMLNEAIGEPEDAFFDLKSFKENQILKQAFYPVRDAKFFSDDANQFPEKDAREIRLIITDLAFSKTHTTQKNDNSIILCMSLHWDKNHFERHVDYVDAFPGGEAPKVIMRLREIFQDYDCDYLIIDLSKVTYDGDIIWKNALNCWKIFRAM